MNGVQNPPQQLQQPDPADAAERRRQMEERLLSDHAYAQRRAMLIMAATTFAISWGGIRLSSIEALGMKISAWNERYLLAFAATILAYLIGNFATLAQPIMVAWRSNFAWFAIESAGVVALTTKQILQVIAETRTALREGGASGEPTRTALALFDKIEGFYGSGEVSKRAESYLELHRARMRFEYQVPVSISIIVLYLVIPRLVLLYIA